MLQTPSEESKSNRSQHPKSKLRSPAPLTRMALPHFEGTADKKKQNARQSGQL